eukprot:EC799020.1.p6 GENE.EC799020.1~~EC799020.1.p6  ORF type:complete len:51 (+),score=8.49 EC799020.1:518-670(+)
MFDEILMMMKREREREKETHSFSQRRETWTINYFAVMRQSTIGRHADDWI